MQLCPIAEAVEHLAGSYPDLMDLPLTPGEHADLSLALLSAMDSLARGSFPGRPEWEAMADVVNVLDTLRAQGRLTGITEADIAAVEQSMALAGGRYHAGRPLRLDGKGFRLLRELVLLWLDLTQTMTRAELLEAYVDTAARIRSALADGTCKVVAIEPERTPA